MSSTSFYSPEELRDLGFAHVGRGVRLSRKASLYNTQNIRIGDNVRIDDFVIITAAAEVNIGCHVHIASFTSLLGSCKITMEDFSGLSSRVAIYTHSADYGGHSLTNPTVPLIFQPKFNEGEVIIGKHAIIGTNSTILPRVVVGEGAAVGAHSLVTKSLAPWEVFFGVPAKAIKTRSRNLLALEEKFLEFWNTEMSKSS